MIYQQQTFTVAEEIGSRSQSIEQKANSYNPLFLQSPKFGGSDVGGAGLGWLGVLAMVLNRSCLGQPMVEVELPVPTSQMFDYLIAA